MDLFGLVLLHTAGSVVVGQKEKLKISSAAYILYDHTKTPDVVTGKETDSFLI